MSSGMPMRLQGVQRHYAWGSTTDIQTFCSLPIDGEPLAEVWFGAHPSAPSTIRYGDQAGMPLDRYIERDPASTLGPAHHRFGDTLPYLVKLLAPAQAVSLQVHPTVLQAEIGFEKENRAEVPLDSPARSFVDRNHKPEMVIALTPFEGLVGFRPASEVADTVSIASRDPLATTLLPLLRRKRLADAFSAVMAAEPSSVHALTSKLAEHSREDPALQRLAELSDIYDLDDPGLIASLFLNAVRLEPGEAVFVNAGVPHSYQRGLAAEVMANSDNVLRAGLTRKHVNVRELVATVEFESRRPSVQTPDVDGRYEVPIDDFVPSLIVDADTLDNASPTIVLALSDNVTVEADGTALPLQRGHACFVPADSGPITVSNGPALVTAAG